MQRSPLVPDVVVDICQQCVPGARNLPGQWMQNGAFVVTRTLPCSGKAEVQYLLHALGEVRNGLCLVACHGSCRHAQGNRRAEVRIATLRKLLGEIGLEPERVELVHCEPATSEQTALAAVRAAVGRLAALGPNPALESAPPAPEARPVAEGARTVELHRAYAVGSDEPRP